MRTLYEVEFWLLALPWVLFGVAAIVLWHSVVCGKRWMKWHDIVHGRALKAEAEARESSAAHQESVRKQNQLALRLAEAEHEITRLTPKHDKLGRFTTKEPKWHH